MLMLSGLAALRVKPRLLSLKILLMENGSESDYPGMIKKVGSKAETLKRLLDARKNPHNMWQ
jgi:hypothetical protein